jgi:large subunit ribosomal protein L17
MNRTSEHVRSMVRNMVVNLLRHERIRTTVKKAKLVRPYAEKMITLGKKGTLHAKRQALAFLRSKPAVVKLFRNVAPRYGDRNGGYTRIVRLAEAIRPASSDKVADFEVPAGTRLGDGTPMVIFELVQGEVRPRQKRRRAAPEPFKPRRELHRKVEQTDEKAEAGEAAEETPAEEVPPEDSVPEGGAEAPSE